MAREKMACMAIIKRKMVMVTFCILKVISMTPALCQKVISRSG